MTSGAGLQENGHLNSIWIVTVKEIRVHICVISSQDNAEAQSWT
jgi:hypothetical protein